MNNLFSKSLKKTDISKCFLFLQNSLSSHSFRRHFWLFSNRFVFSFFALYIAVHQVRWRIFFSCKEQETLYFSPKTGEHLCKWNHRVHKVPLGLPFNSALHLVSCDTPGYFSSSEYRLMGKLTRSVFKPNIFFITFTSTKCTIKKTFPSRCNALRRYFICKNNCLHRGKASSKVKYNIALCIKINLHTYNEDFSVQCWTLNESTPFPLFHNVLSSD